MQTVKALQNQLVEIPGVTHPVKSTIIIIEVSPENCEPIAKLLNLPDCACIGVPQFIGALTAMQIRTEKRLDHGKVLHLAYLEYNDIARLLPA